LLLIFHLSQSPNTTGVLQPESETIVPSALLQPHPVCKAFVFVVQVLVEVVVEVTDAKYAQKFSVHFPPLPVSGPSNMNHQVPLL
jgi:hypothetical protein